MLEEIYTWYMSTVEGRGRTTCCGTIPDHPERSPSMSRIPEENFGPPIV